MVSAKAFPGKYCRERGRPAFLKTHHPHSGERQPLVPASSERLITACLRRFLMSAGKIRDGPQTELDGSPVATCRGPSVGVSCRRAPVALTRAGLPLGAPFGVPWRTAIRFVFGNVPSGRSSSPCRRRRASSLAGPRHQCRCRSCRSRPTGRPWRLSLRTVKASRDCGYGLSIRRRGECCAAPRVHSDPFWAPDSRRSGSLPRDSQVGGDRQ